jgi:hypothetical protein
MGGFMRKSLAVGLSSLVLIAAICDQWPAQANSISKSEAKSFYALKMKLVRLTADMTDSARQAAAAGNATVLSCLGTIKPRALIVTTLANEISSLVTLAAFMRDEIDEILLLREIKISIAGTIEQLPVERQVINQTMVICSNVATANVKGQAFLNIISELEDTLSLMADKVR